MVHFVINFKTLLARELSNFTHVQNPNRLLDGKLIIYSLSEKSCKYLYVLIWKSMECQLAFVIDKLILLLADQNKPEREWHRYTAIPRILLTIHYKLRVARAEIVY